MSDWASVVASHHLGKAEAKRRIDERFARTNGQLGGTISVGPQAWQGDTLRFRRLLLGRDG